MLPTVIVETSPMECCASTPAGRRVENTFLNLCSVHPKVPVTIAPPRIMLNIITG